LHDPFGFRNPPHAALPSFRPPKTGGQEKLSADIIIGLFVASNSIDYDHNSKRRQMHLLY
jgi:hypothetical protein